MAVTIGTISNFGGSSGYPWTFTSAGSVNTTGAKALLVFITNQSTGKSVPTNVRYGGSGGQVMTHIGTSDVAGGMIYAFGLVAPTITTSGVLYVHHSSANGDPSNYTVIPITNCDLTNPFGAFDADTAASAATATTSIVTTAASSVIFSAITAVFGPAMSAWTIGGSVTPVAVIENATQTAIPLKLVKQDAGASGSTVTTTNQTAYNNQGLLSVEVKDGGGPAAQVLEPDGLLNAASALGTPLAKDPNVFLLAPTSLASTSTAFGAHTLTRQDVLFFDQNSPDHTATGTPATIVERTSGSPNYRVSRASTPVVSSEKKYWEVTIDNLATSSTISLGGGIQALPLNAQLGGYQSNAIGWDSSGGARQNNSGLSGRPSYATGDILMFAMDMVNGRLFGGKNGVWYNGTTAGNVNFASGDGSINSAGWTTTNGFYAAVETGTIGDKVSFNFGKQTFAYSLPTGYDPMDTGAPPNQDIEPDGISSTSSFGSHSVQNQLQIVSPVGLSAALTLGTPEVSYIAYPLGFTYSPALGTPTVSYRTLVMGIYNPILLGTPAVIISTWDLEPTGITAASYFGTPAAHLGMQVPSILSDGALGDPEIIQIIRHAGIENTPLLGDHAIGLPVWELNVQGINNVTYLGNPQVNQVVTFPSIVNVDLFGAHLIDYVYTDAGIYPQGINNLSAFGAHNINMVLHVDSILAELSQFGLPTIQSFNALSVSGISLDPQLGSHALNLRLNVYGFTNLSSFGVPKIVQYISTDSLSLNPLFGLPSVVLLTWELNPASIINNAALGIPQVAVQYANATKFTKVGGVWVAADRILVKENGQWRELLSCLEKVDGSWQSIS
jgi:hypothetical protein